MKLFVAQDNESIAVGVIVVVLFISLIIWGITTMSAAGLLLAVFSLIVGVPTLILTIMTKKFGLYINDEKLVFKRFKVKENYK